MARRLTITFPSDRPYDFYDRVFWFAESLHDPIIASGLGTMNDVDKARETIWIDLIDRHSLGSAKKIIRKALAHYSLSNDALISIE